MNCFSWLLLVGAVSCIPPLVVMVVETLIAAVPVMAAAFGIADSNSDY
jgi:hypothetical protein